MGLLDVEKKGDVVGVMKGRELRWLPRDSASISSPREVHNQ